MLSLTRPLAREVLKLVILFACILLKKNCHVVPFFLDDAKHTETSTICRNALVNNQIRTPFGMGNSKQQCDLSKTARYSENDWVASRCKFSKSTAHCSILFFNIPALHGQYQYRITASKRNKNTPETCHGNAGQQYRNTTSVAITR